VKTAEIEVDDEVEEEEEEEEEEEDGEVDDAQALLGIEVERLFKLVSEALDAEKADDALLWKEQQQQGDSLTKLRFDLNWGCVDGEGLWFTCCMNRHPPPLNSPLTISPQSLLQQPPLFF
jgi:hypothetical protein